MKTTVWQGILLGKPHRATIEKQDGHYRLVLEEIIEEGSLTDLVKGGVSFAKANPVLTGFMTSWASQALTQYTKNKKETMRLYAPTPADRSKYLKLVQELKRIGWTVVRSRYLSGSGYEWELKQR